MRKPEEYIQDDSQYEVMSSDEELYKWEDIEDMIKQAQKEAWNEALDEAAKLSGYISEEDNPILKLKIK